jgi:hypothetical protein
MAKRKKRIRIKRNDEKNVGAFSFRCWWASERHGISNHEGNQPLYDRCVAFQHNTNHGKFDCS